MPKPTIFQSILHLPTQSYSSIPLYDPNNPSPSLARSQSLGKKPPPIRTTASTGLERGSSNVSAASSGRGSKRESRDRAVVGSAPHSRSPSLDSSGGRLYLHNNLLGSEEEAVRGSKTRERRKRTLSGGSSNSVAASPYLAESASRSSSSSKNINKSRNRVSFDVQTPPVPPIPSAWKQPKLRTYPSSRSRGRDDQDQDQGVPSNSIEARSISPDPIIPTSPSSDSFSHVSSAASDGRGGGGKAGSIASGVSGSSTRSSKLKISKRISGRPSRKYATTVADEDASTTMSMMSDHDDEAAVSSVGIRTPRSDLGVSQAVLSPEEFAANVRQMLQRPEPKPQLSRETTTTKSKRPNSEVWNTSDGARSAPDLRRNSGYAVAAAATARPQGNISRDASTKKRRSRVHHSDRLPIDHDEPKALSPHGDKPEPPVSLKKQQQQAAPELEHRANAATSNDRDQWPSKGQVSQPPAPVAAIPLPAPSQVPETGTFIPLMNVQRSATLPSMNASSQTRPQQPQRPPPPPPRPIFPPLEDSGVPESSQPWLLRSKSLQGAPRPHSMVQLSDTDTSQKLPISGNIEPSPMSSYHRGPLVPNPVMVGRAALAHTRHSFTASQVPRPHFDQHPSISETAPPSQRTRVMSESRISGLELEDPKSLKGKASPSRTSDEAMGRDRNREWQTFINSTNHPLHPTQLDGPSPPGTNSIPIRRKSSLPAMRKGQDLPKTSTPATPSPLRNGEVAENRSSNIPPPSSSIGSDVQQSTTRELPPETKFQLSGELIDALTQADLLDKVLEAVNKKSSKDEARPRVVESTEETAELSPLAGVATSREKTFIFPPRPELRDSVSASKDFVEEERVVISRPSPPGDFKVHLESARFAPSKPDTNIQVKFHILVANISFHKFVLVRYSLDEWTTSSESIALWKESFSDKADKFECVVELSRATSEGRMLMACIKYEVDYGAQVWWDNNEGVNYAIEIPTPTAGPAINTSIDSTDSKIPISSQAISKDDPSLVSITTLSEPVTQVDTALPGLPATPSFVSRSTSPIDSVWSDSVPTPSTDFTSPAPSVTGGKAKPAAPVAQSVPRLTLTRTESEQGNSTADTRVDTALVIDSSPQNREEPPVQTTFDQDPNGLAHVDGPGPLESSVGGTRRRSGIAGGVATRQRNTLYDSQCAGSLASLPEDEEILNTHTHHRTRDSVGTWSDVSSRPVTSRAPSILSTLDSLSESKANGRPELPPAWNALPRRAQSLFSDDTDVQSESGYSSMTLPTALAYRPQKKLAFASDVPREEATSMLAIAVSANITTSKGGSLFRKLTFRKDTLPPHLRRSSFDPTSVLTCGPLNRPPNNIRADQVLVQVYCVALDCTDASLLGDILANGDAFGWVPGRSFVGKAIEIGASIKHVKTGDLVFGLQSASQCGALAELLKVDAQRLSSAPNGRLSLEQIAQLPLCGVSAFQTCVSLSTDLPNGSKILILNAHEGTGALAMQLFRSMRTNELWITAHAPPDAQDASRLLKGNGASEVLIRDAVDALLNLPESSFDIVMDNIGGRHIYDAGIRVLHHNTGAFVTTVGDDPANLGPVSDWKHGVRAQKRTFFKKKKKKVSYWLVKPDRSEDIRDALDEVREAAQRGEIRPPVRRIIPFKQGANAFLPDLGAGTVVRIV